MKLKTIFTVFEDLSFGEKIKIWWKIADTSFKGIAHPKISKKLSAGKIYHFKIF